VLKVELSAAKAGSPYDFPPHTMRRRRYQILT